MLDSKKLTHIFRKINPVCSGCWEWTGNIGSHGYALYGSKRILIHRLMWSYANKRQPLKGMHICHKCDNTKCVNPEHLFEGTTQDNTKDRESKGRTARGKTSGMFKHGKYSKWITHE